MNEKNIQNFNKYNLIWKLDDNRFWSTAKASFISEHELEKLLLNNPSSIVQDAPRDKHGHSNIEGLIEALLFYGLPLGELVMFSQQGIKEKLAQLDAEYLTPRVLASLAIGDTYAIEQWQEHEKQAMPLRKRLDELNK